MVEEDSRMRTRVGFAGLGNIGMPMARNLIDERFDLCVYDVAAEPLEEFSSVGARVARDPRELARAGEIIGVCVRDDAQVEALLLGPEGLLASADAGTAVAVHSTVRPATIRDLAAVGGERGVHVIDAPITGGAPAAAARTLTYMVGGEADLLERCRPVFETSARTIVHTGPLGTGLWMKLCNNLMTYQSFQAAFEASLLAKTAGLSFEVFEEVTTSNGNLTDQMRAFLGLRDALEARADDAGLRQLVAGFAALAEKDLSIALESASELGLVLSGTVQCRENMARVYGADGDSSAGTRGGGA
jgi:3-hydroxyisobutyrate dehydrogenase-like beta-hydroxyacid dehydrogenase